MLSTSSHTPVAVSVDPHRPRAADVLHALRFLAEQREHGLGQVQDCPFALRQLFEVDEVVFEATVPFISVLVEVEHGVAFDVLEPGETLRHCVGDDNHPVSIVARTSD